MSSISGSTRLVCAFAVFSRYSFSILTDSFQLFKNSLRKVLSSLVISPEVENSSSNRLAESMEEALPVELVSDGSLGSD